MDFSFLANPQGVQLPDPVQTAIRGLTLQQLTRQNQAGQEDLLAKQQSREDQNAAAQVFADAQTMGWQAALLRAAQSNPRGAALALRIKKDQEGADAKVELDRASAEEKRAQASKYGSDAKKDAFGTFAPLAVGIASGKVPVTAQTQGALFESARALLPEQVWRTAPSDPAAFQQWASQFADPKTLQDIWEKAKTVPAQVAKDTAMAGKANAETTLMPREVAAREMSARASATSAGAAAQNAATNRMQYENPNMQHATDANGNPISFNPRGGSFSAAKDAGGNPLPLGSKRAPEAYSKQTAGIANLNTAIQEYQDALTKWGTLDVLSPDARADMGTKYNNMMLQAKEAYNLGVLNGPDYQILQSVVADPTSLRGVVTSNDAMSKQAGELGRIMQQNAKNLATVYKQPQQETTGESAAPSGGKVFKSLPDPSTLTGRRMRADDGTIYRSDGKRWVRE